MVYLSIRLNAGCLHPSLSGRSHLCHPIQHGDAFHVAGLREEIEASDALDLISSLYRRRLISTFSTFFFDYDLDGLLDVLAVNGHVADDIAVTQPHLRYAEPALVFRNRGKGQFENMSTQLGTALQQPIVGRGAAYGDFDNDGDLDLVITEANGPARLLRNENGNQNDMLRVKLIGTRSNRDGIGAKLTLQVDKNLRLQRMVKTGSGYLSQSEFPITFGLGKPDPSRKMRLAIAWPSGHKDTLENLTPNQSIIVQEGKGITATQPITLQKVKRNPSS